MPAMQIKRYDVGIESATRPWRSARRREQGVLVNMDDDLLPLIHWEASPSLFGLSRSIIGRTQYRSVHHWREPFKDDLF
jgi:hypothetical protein